MTDAEIGAAAALGLQIRVVGEGDLEGVRRPDAGAEAATNGRPGDASLVLPRDEPSRQTRADRSHRLVAKGGAWSKCAGVALERVAADGVGTQPGTEAGARAQILSHLGEASKRAALDRHFLKLLAGDVGAARALAEAFHTSGQTGGRREDHVGLRACADAARFEERVAEAAVIPVVQVGHGDLPSLLNASGEHRSPRQTSVQPKLALRVKAARDAIDGGIGANRVAAVGPGIATLGVNPPEISA